MAMAAPPRCSFLTTYNRFCPFVPCTAMVHGAPGHNRWEVSETTLPVKTQERTLGCPFNFRPPRIVAGWFHFVSPGPSGSMRASEQSVVRHAHSLRCESATWVAAQPAVPDAVTRARRSQQCWL